MVPSPEDEDRRRLCREREALVTERIRHTNRIMLAGQGIPDFDPLRPKHRERLDELKTGDGRPLPPCLLAEIRRQLGRLDAVVRDLATVEAERNGLVGVRSTDRPTPRAEEAAEPGGVAEMVAVPVAPETGPAVAPEEVAPGAASETAPAGASAASETAPAEPAALLMRLKGIGPEFAAVLWFEALFRSFGNRRQIAAYAGLAPVPWQSGGIERDQGIAKAGNPRLRKTMIQLAWLWIRHQPGSAISQWFARRVGTARGRVRRIAIVAVARKLLVALWRYVTHGVVPEGAVLKA
jgi:transposase